MDGQFSDAEEDSSDKFCRGKPLLLERNLTDVNDSTEGVIADDSEDEYSEDDYLDSMMDKCNLKDYSVTNTSSNKSSYQPSDNLFKKFINKINVGNYGEEFNHCSDTKAFNRVDKKNYSQRVRHKDKTDRATVEQVLDPRTRVILFKLLNKGFISSINGCISTGKEANVYHATSDSGDRAIKVFKTSILVFKDRDKYVTGEYRFRHGYCRHNPRKMVKTWAEKEMRNLNRMHAAGVPVPKSYLLKNHVLVMDFVGHEGWAAPKLKDVDLTSSKACSLYRDCVIIMWNIYNKSKLVHADLSEFNMLYHNGQVVIIDVSQSVEHEHPHALEFLRKDCTNINEYFKKRDVATMTVKELFDFITDPTITEENMECYLDKISEIAASRLMEERTSQEIIDEEVFKQTYIPKSLHQVVDAERDIDRGKAGTGDLVYTTITGIKSDLSAPQLTPGLLEESEHSKSSDDSSDSESEDKKQFNVSARPRDESPNSKKLRKRAAKEEKAEKRKTKIKKNVKKRKEKTGRANSKK